MKKAAQILNCIRILYSVIIHQRGKRGQVTQALTAFSDSSPYVLGLIPLIFMTAMVLSCPPLN